MVEVWAEAWEAEVPEEVRAVVLEVQARQGKVYLGPNRDSEAGLVVARDLAWAWAPDYYWEAGGDAVFGGLAEGAA